MRPNKTAREWCSPNSFYRFGNEDILHIEQDALSKLWKIKFTTREHYVVSREFDRSRGMYGGAPDDVIRVALMEYSDMLLGDELSIWSVIDLFIGRCFDDSAFMTEPVNAFWLSMDYLHYDEMEDLNASYGVRIVWPKDDDGPTLRDIILKYSPRSNPNSEALRDRFNELVRRYSVKMVFMKDEGGVAELMRDPDTVQISCFRPEYKSNGDFTGFAYVGRDL